MECIGTLNQQINVKLGIGARFVESVDQFARSVIMHGQLPPLPVPCGVTPLHVNAAFITTLKSMLVWAGLDSLTVSIVREA